MEPNVFVEVSSRDFERIGGAPVPHSVKASAPPKEKDFTLHSDEGIVELTMKGDVEGSSNPFPPYDATPRRGYDRSLTVRLSLKTCERLVDFLHSKGLLSVNVSGLRR